MCASRTIAAVTATCDMRISEPQSKLWIVTGPVRLAAQGTCWGT